MEPIHFPRLLATGPAKIEALNANQRKSLVLGQWECIPKADRDLYRFVFIKNPTVSGGDTSVSVEQQTKESVSVDAADFRTRVLGAAHPYAPLGEIGAALGTDDAYYIRLNQKQQTFLMSDKSWALNRYRKSDSRPSGSMYVSLRYLQALALKELAWDPVNVTGLNPPDKLARDGMEREIGTSENFAALRDGTRLQPLVKILKEHLNIPSPVTFVQAEVKAVSPNFDYVQAVEPEYNEFQANVQRNPNGELDAVALRRCIERIHEHSCKDRKSPCVDDCPKLYEFLHGLLPYRSDDGELHFGHYLRPYQGVVPAPPIMRSYHCFTRSQWFHYWQTTQKPVDTRKTGKSTFVARYESQRLSRPLVIYLLPGAQKRFCNAYCGSGRNEDSSTKAKPDKNDSKSEEANQGDMELEEQTGHGHELNTDDMAQNGRMLVEQPPLETNEDNLHKDPLGAGLEAKFVPPTGAATEPPKQLLEIESEITSRLIFERLIARINAQEYARSPRKPGLELAPRDWKPRDRYVLLSNDPFRLFQTYIHVECVHEYMDGFTRDRGTQHATAMKLKTKKAKNAKSNKVEKEKQSKDKAGTGRIAVNEKFDPIRRFPMPFNTRHKDKDERYMQKFNDLVKRMNDPLTKDSEDDAREDDAGNEELQIMEEIIFSAVDIDGSEAIEVRRDNTENMHGIIPRPDDARDRESPQEAEFTQRGGEIGDSIADGAIEEEEYMEIGTTKNDTSTNKPKNPNTEITMHNGIDSEEPRENIEVEATKEDDPTKKPEDMTRRLHVPRINAYKVANAGSRKGSGLADQKKVMGFTAPLLASKVLGWNWHDTDGDRFDRQMDNLLYIAEWAHMSAYSWGGISDGSGKEAHSSSQTKENLAFATSEANSCMMRYEKAWQQLFRDEFVFTSMDALVQAQTAQQMNLDQPQHRQQAPDVDKKKIDACIEDSKDGKKVKDSDQNLQGELIVTQNTKHGPYIADEFDEKTRKYVWVKKPALTDKDALWHIATKVPFLAYNIRYELRLAGKSHVLAPTSRRKPARAQDTQPPTLVHMNVNFYPFSRRFCHRYESLLDKAVYQAMFMMSAMRKYSDDSETTKRLIKKRFGSGVFDTFKSEILKQKEPWSGEVKRPAPDIIFKAHPVKRLLKGSSRERVHLVGHPKGWRIGFLQKPATKN